MKIFSAASSFSRKSFINSSEKFLRRFIEEWLSCVFFSEILLRIPLLFVQHSLGKSSKKSIGIFFRNFVEISLEILREILFGVFEILLSNLWKNSSRVYLRISFRVSFANLSRYLLILFIAKSLQRFLVSWTSLFLSFGIHPSILSRLYQENHQKFVKGFVKEFIQTISNKTAQTVPSGFSLNIASGKYFGIKWSVFSLKNFSRESLNNFSKDSFRNSYRNPTAISPGFPSNKIFFGELSKKCL